MTRGRPEAAALFANPEGPAARAARRATELRRSGVVRALIAGAIAALLYFLGRPVLAGVAGTLGTMTLLLALASPTVGYAALSRIVDRAGELVGSALAWLLLAPVFFLFLTPFRWLFRRGAKDTLARGFDRAAPSYWSAHGRERDLEKPY